MLCSVVVIKYSISLILLSLTVLVLNSLKPQRTHTDMNSACIFHVTGCMSKLYWNVAFGHKEHVNFKHFAMDLKVAEQKCPLNWIIVMPQFSSLKLTVGWSRCTSHKTCTWICFVLICCICIIMWHIIHVTDLPTLLTGTPLVLPENYILCPVASFTNMVEL